MSKSKKVVCKVTLENSSKQTAPIRSALTWLDNKIEEYMSYPDNTRYTNSKRAISEFSEINGVLKFLYMSEIISAEEKNRIISEMTGEIEEEIA